MKRTIGLAAAAVCMAAGFLAMQAAAGSTVGVVVIPEDQWQFDAVLYGYYPTIKGKSTFPLGDGPTIDPNQIFNHLKFAFLGNFEAHKGDWGVFTDLMYLNLGDHRNRTQTLETPAGPVPITGDFDVGVKSTVWTVAGTYAVVRTSDLTLQLLAGARLLDAKQSITIVGTGPAGGVRSYNGEISQNFWNGIVGAKGRYAFGPDRKWFIPYYVDLGTGDSQFTWQVSAGVGYSFGWGDIGATYRYLDYQMKSSAKIQELSLSGPVLGVALHW